MKILAFETSCDETAASVVEDGRRILSNAVYSQVELHALYGGVVPEIASRAHVEKIYPIAKKALDDARLALEDIDAIAATCAPGLIGALLVGVNFAKALAYAKGKPFIPVHHIRGHIAANYLHFDKLTPPFCALVVSGGNSIIADVRDYTNIVILGGTRDDAAGEVFDKISRFIGLGYPGGAKIDALSKGGDEKKYSLPRSEVSGSSYDMSFSGLKTAGINLIQNMRARGEEIDLKGFAASFSKAVSDTLVPRAVSAAAALSYGKLVAAGGVCANSLLREDLIKKCDAGGLQLFLPPLSLCGDNAAMIASQAYYEFRAGNISGLAQNAYATKDISEGFSGHDYK